MARVKLNPMLEEVRGSVGDIVFKRYRGRIIASKKADMSNVKPSPKQLAHQERFKAAAAYARKAKLDPDTWALYERIANERGMQTQNAAVGDFFNAPVIEKLDLSGYTGAIGDPILVQAADDVGVVAVTVVITDTEGEVIEEGAARQSGAESWTYTATAGVPGGTTVRVAVAAKDRPGGKGERVV